MSNSSSNEGEGEPPSDTLKNLKRVGPYMIEDKLGEGSFAVVRQGIHMGTMETVRPRVVLPPPSCCSAQASPFRQCCRLTLIRRGHVYGCGAQSPIAPRLPTCGARVRLVPSPMPPRRRAASLSPRKFHEQFTNQALSVSCFHLCALTCAFVWPAWSL